MTIKWDEESLCLITPSGERYSPIHQANREFTAPLAAFEDICIEDLAHALRSSAKSLSGDLSERVNLNLWFPTNSPSIADREAAWYDQQGMGPFSESLDVFSLDNNNNILMDFEVRFPLVKSLEGLNSLLGPILTGIGVQLIDAKYRDTLDGPSTQLWFTIDPSWRIARANEFSNLVRTCLRHSTMDPRSVHGAYLLVISGFPEGLIGQPESEWLEVKRKGYALREESQKHELAMDLAAFANSDQGGLIIIGAGSTKDAAGRDTISSVVGCSPGSLPTDEYLMVANSRITPPIEGLQIQLVNRQEHHLAIIRIPKQFEYLKPFLVKGALTSTGRVTGAAFTIPRRAGTSRSNMSAEAVHSLLVAARALLRSPSPSDSNDLA